MLRRGLVVACRAALLQAEQQHASAALPSLALCQQELTSLVGRRALHASAARGSALAELSAPPEPPPLPVQDAWDQEEPPQSDLTPSQVVERLDRYIVGQADAKRAVAVALRNRFRRHKLGPLLRAEVVPKNILMIGPTGCGKTEIARRLAKLADAPFVKVESTTYTETGFHGRDVDQIIRDLVDAAMIQTRAKLQRAVRAEVDKAVEEKIIASLVGTEPAKDTKDTFTRLYREGKLENNTVSIEVPAQRPPNPLAGFGEHGGLSMQHVVFNVNQLLTPRGKGDKRKVKVSEARQLLREAESERLINADTVQREAISAVEQDGIVFIDEIDKITQASDGRYGGADASSEGVQRDLLPIIEGCQVTTKYGTVATDHILFICSGAFHSCKPSDMLAELQGRLPIRVELKGLSAADFVRILTEPEHNLIRQQQALLETEGIELRFSGDAIQEIARVAEQVNSTVENIGARRLHTVMERILEDISFEAPDLAREKGHSPDNPLRIDVDAALVQERLRELLQSQDLSKYIL